ncbi:MAG: hypothetical protein HC876_18720 [Chloroflexaceae bacterium]|nr:hypothetical protein [Chloroflexaceae bacterium]NJO07379.1 hypothetical protein [Chloroflexaceae bacterium]
MQRIRWLFLIITLGVCVVILLATLAMQSPVRSADNLIPTPVGASSLEQTPTPNATQQPIAQLRQPDGNRRVHLGSVSRMSALPASQPITYTVNQTYGLTNTRLVITNTVTSEAIRLGNDLGSATFVDINERYVLWSFACKQLACKPDGSDPLPTGHYLYNLETATSQPFMLADDYGLAAGRLGQQWVVFATLLSTQHVRLYAGHLDSGQVVIVEDMMEFPANDALDIATHRLFDVVNDTVIWTQAGLHRYDLTTGISETLNIPAALTPARSATGLDPSPQGLTISENAVIWESYGYWWGYDFVTEQYFPIETLPPEWEGVMQTYTSYIQLHSDTLSWPMLVVLEDRSETRYYFTASIVRADPNTSQTPEDTIYLPLIVNKIDTIRTSAERGDE